ncbi:hypothetical protein RDABS01_001055 [Bienertia sinuspersici]
MCTLNQNHFRRRI